MKQEYWPPNNNDDDLDLATKEFWRDFMKMVRYKAEDKVAAKYGKKSIYDVKKQKEDVGVNTEVEREIDAMMERVKQNLLNFCDVELYQ